MIAARIKKLEAAAGDPTTLAKLKAMALRQRLADGIASSSAFTDVLDAMPLCPDVDEPVEAFLNWWHEFNYQVAVAIVGKNDAYTALGWPEPGKTAQDIVAALKKTPEFIAFKQTRCSGEN